MIGFTYSKQEKIIFRFLSCLAITEIGILGDKMGLMKNVAVTAGSVVGGICLLYVATVCGARVLSSTIGTEPELKQYVSRTAREAGIKKNVDAAIGGVENIEITPEGWRIVLPEGSSQYDARYAVYRVCGYISRPDESAVITNLRASLEAISP